MSKKQYETIFTLAAKKQSSFSAAFSSAKSEFQALYKEAANLKKQQADISAYERQMSAVESTKNSLTRYQEKLAAVQEALKKMGESSDTSAQDTAKFQQQQAELQYKVSETTRKLTEQQEKADAMGAALQQAGVDTSNLGAESTRLGQELSEVNQKMDEVEDQGGVFDGAASSLDAFAAVAAAAGMGKLLQEIADGMKACADAAVEFEYSMAGVQRTVGGSEEYLSDLSDSFLEMSTEMPITTTELASIATTAGQLGIAQEYVEDFTSVMAQLATTTDLTADDAATMLAQFANITGTSDYERLGSTVAELGDATATTASKVVEMSQGMAAAASIAGFSETDILAVAAAVGSLGIESQAGSTAMSTLIQTLYTAVETGGDDLTNFASVAGMSASEFASAWGEDPVMAMDAFIQGLNDTERNGKSAIVLLNELGITNVRQSKAILGLASAGDLLSSTVEQASSAWEENTALGEKASIMYETTQSKLEMMQNAYNNLKIAIGNNYTPALSVAYEAGEKILEWTTDVVEQNPELVSGITATTTAFAALTAGIVTFNAAKTAASKLGLATLLPAAGTVATIAAAAAALGLVVAAVSSASNAYDEIYEESLSLTDASREQQAEIESLTAQYDALVDAGEQNSAKAIVLKNRIDELTEEFENSKQSISEFSTEVTEMAASVQDSWTAYADGMQSIDDQEESSANLIERLRELSSQADITSADEAEMSAIIDELNSRYEGLNLTLDDVSGKSPVSLDTVETLAKARAAQERYNAAYEQYGTMAMETDELVANQAQALAELQAAEEELAAVEAERQAVYDTGNMFMGLEAEYEAAAEKVTRLRDDYDEATAAVEANADGLADAHDILVEYADAAGMVTEETDAMSAAYAEAESAVEELVEAYNEAYDAALESFQGQFGAFEDVEEQLWWNLADDAVTTTATVISALESQTAYWDSYAANLDTVNSRIAELNSQGYDTSGLEAYVNYANDGSEEAASAFASMAGASDDTLLTIGDNYTALCASQEAAATSTATLATDFDGSMQEIVASLQSAVESMNMSGTAAEAAESTMNGYISSLNAAASKAYNAGAYVASRALAGLRSKTGSGITVSVSGSSGYASGTESAEPGWHWVGEEGPELMRFQGGEQVMTHSESVDFAEQLKAYGTVADQYQSYEAAQKPVEMDYDQRTTQTNVTVAPTIQINGVGSKGDMQDISDELMENIKDFVFDAMEEAGIDAKRGALT